MHLYKLFLASYLTLLFFFLLFINLYYLEGIPHVPDSAAYLFMAKMFATGHLIMPIPISPEHFNFFRGILSVEKGTWLFQYPFGHPLLLTIGVLFGFPNVIPPLIGVIFALILFLIAKELFDLKTAIFTVILPALSPFFLENASSFMSHNTSAFYLMLAFYFLLLSLKVKAKIFSLLSGISLGLLFNTRPLTFSPFFIIHLLILLLKHKPNEKIASFMLFIFGLSLMAILWLLYNYSTTGDMFTSQLYLVNKGMLEIIPREPLGAFFKEHYKNTSVLFNNFGPMLFNWPVLITYSILLVPFLFRKNTFWDNIFFISLFTLPSVYFFYNGQFLMYGPRFWYEVTPFVFLITARSLSILSNYFPRFGIVIFLILMFLSFGKLFSLIPTKDPDMMSPLALQRLRGINGVDRGIINAVEKNKIHNAVVFVKDCAMWWCYGSIFSQNSPYLDTNIVYAKDLGDEKNKKLSNHFQRRSFYRIDYYSLKLERILYFQ